MGSSDPYPVSLDSLHFPSREQTISQTLSSLRRSALSVTNRLLSIDSDAAFVREVADYYDLPLVANERCGSWYIPLDIKAGSAYFKSTDGHTGKWDFSFRRLNLQILPLAQQHGGCIIVDSTRRDAPRPPVMPDALSKTVPIWCAVINRTLFPAETTFHPVQFPPNFLGASEESQIEHRINGFVKSLQDLKLDLNALRQQLRKPIQVAWANRAYFHPTDLRKSNNYHLFVLCSASKRVHGAEMSEGGYIQGAGDDSEGWAHGLTPPVFWPNKDTLLRTPEEDLPALIEGLVAAHHRKQDVAQQATRIAPTHNLFIGQSDPTLSESGRYDLVINCNGSPGDLVEGNSKRLNLGCASQKLGSRDLRKHLDKVQAFVAAQLGPHPSRSLLVTCESGKDLSAGAALAIVCLFYSENGEFSLTPARPRLDKQFIRQRLAWIVSSQHDVNPSRSTLQSINAFLMERPDY
ncbi:hypothetical protein FE257_008965 [Aspergillus nanangensis]|uniref:tRNA a64-2'-o-ribosylphosphate transferase n=1 Tax=Aspergillus nanangensis TaxID=2582783 RepID=A0AAD4CWH4_ASPNN|nr:hypothetical protein FE257_008965 [Aspergillus nanangensis]